MAEQMGDNAIDSTGTGEVADDPVVNPITEAERQAIRAIDLASLSSSKREPRDPPSVLDAYRKSLPRSAPLPGMSINGGVIEKSPPFRVSPALDESHIKSLDGYEEFAGYLKPAVEALSVCSTGLQAIANARTLLHKDSSKTSDAKLSLVAREAEKKREQMHRILVKAQEDLSKAAELMELELNAPVVSAATATATNAELRTVLRQMKPDERNAVIADAVRDGDATVVNAVLGVHHLITGVDPLRHQTWTRLVHEQRNPTLVRRLAATRKALAVVERAAPIALTSVETAMGGTFREVQKIRGLAGEADKALAAIRG